MSNCENLKPVRTEQEARELGRNGGKASGKARRARKTMKERAQMLVDCKLRDENIIETYKALGVKADKLTLADAMILGQIMGAITGKGGDPKAFKAVLDLLTSDNGQDDAVDDHNDLMRTIADLLKNPSQNREISDYEGGGDDG